MSIETLSAKELRKAANLKEQIADLETELNHILGSPATTSPKPPRAAKKKRGMSAAGRARVAAAQKARWAKVRAEKK